MRLRINLSANFQANWINRSGNDQNWLLINQRFTDHIVGKCCSWSMVGASMNINPSITDKTRPKGLLDPKVRDD